ncbi:MAG: carboxypeptidase-like regulatory domain-containing protein [Candidatus Acidiferrales bacterium]
MPNPLWLGSISGTVVDHSGAIVSGAQIRLTREDRSSSEEALSDADGGFAFANVAPGSFQLTIASEGFATQVFPGTAREGEAYHVVLAVSAFSLDVLDQDEAPIIKSEVMSAFVWGEDAPSGAISSTIQDPLSGNTIHALSYNGIEVSSRMGFERVGAGEVGIFLNYTATIVNGTDSTLSVRYGGISVDGRAASPFWVVPLDKKLSKKERQSKPDAVEVEKIRCITSGFLSSDNLFSANTSSHVFTIAPRSALTVSSVIRDPRNYHSVRCSVGGCYPTGTMRYYLNVGNQNYVFVWPGRSAVYCGK